MLQSTWRESASGPTRRYYRIAPDGDAAVRAIASQRARFRDSVDTVIQSGSNGMTPGTLHLLAEDYLRRL